MNYRQARAATLEGIDDDQAQAWLGSYLDVFAHNLAQVQRQMLIDDGYTTPCVCGGCAWCVAQDFIDAIDPRSRT